MIEVRTDGRAGQLITVLEPTRGDRILRRDGEMWLRPRNLHRLTRLPPELRLFGGAAISDVAAVDLLHDYEGRARPESCQGSADYVLDLVPRGRGGRYAKGVLVVECGRWAPRRLELMTRSGKTLKVIAYADVMPVLDGEIATRLEIEDAVTRDASTVRLFDFAYLTPGETRSLTPEYLLSMRP
jgi:hypothetical protein